MKTFKKYIVEARMTSYEEIASAVAGYKNAGEILNPQYQDLGSQARRIFAKDCDYVRDLMLAHMRAGDKTDDLSDLYYSWPNDSFAALGKSAKLLAKLKDATYSNLVKAGNDVVSKWKPIADDIKDLKGKVVKVAQKRAEVKAAAEKVMTKKMTDSSSLIKIFESHLAEYIEMARKRSAEFVKAKLDDLKKHGWDLDKVAPRPNSRTMGHDDYKYAQNKRSVYSSFVKAKSSYHKPGEPAIVEPNPAIINHYIDLNVKGAEEAYRNFMAKMIQKIGKPVIDAKMVGNIWTNATLTVTCDDGESQVWSTQMILNFSKYQKMFNQFPSRRKS